MNLKGSRPKRIILNGAIYFVTCNTYGRHPWFENDLLCQMFIEQLILVKQIHKFKLFAFCLLHDHFHMLLEPRNSISKAMQSLKRNFTWNLNRFTESDAGATSSRLRSGWGKSNPQNFRWQSSYHDHIIRNERDFQNHFLYTTNNFHKHGLPKNWKYVSTNYPGLID